MNSPSSILERPATSAARSGLARRFMPEEITPLFHTPEYVRLPEEARARYNQLYALYFNEQVAFFEQEMLSPALRALRRAGLPDDLRRGVQVFHDEEQRHTAMFRALNLRWAPELYPDEPYYFVRAARPVRTLLRALSGQPRIFPLLLWLALLQEERSLYYSKRCLEKSAVLEPDFVAAHRAHLADEVGHVGWYELLLDWLWPRAGRALRAVNARLLGWMVGEFFHLPKRAGWRVVGQLIREFPQLDGPALRRAMENLKTNPSFRRTLYSRQIAPRTFGRFDAHPEFASLVRTLTGQAAIQT